MNRTVTCLLNVGLLTALCAVYWFCAPVFAACVLPLLLLLTVYVSRFLRDRFSSVCARAIAGGMCLLCLTVSAALFGVQYRVFCPDRDAAASLGLAMLDLQAIALLLPPCCIFTTAAFPKLRRTVRAMVCVGWLALLVGLLIVLEKCVLTVG